MALGLAQVVIGRAHSSPYFSACSSDGSSSISGSKLRLARQLANRNILKITARPMKIASSHPPNAPCANTIGTNSAFHNTSSQFSVDSSQFNAWGLLCQLDPTQQRI